HAGEDERPQVDAAARSPGRHQVRQAGAHDQQPQHRLHQARHHPQLVAPEPQQLPVQDDLHGAHVLPQAGLGHPDADDPGGRTRPRAGLARRAHLRIARITALLRSPAPASASRIVVPVNDMNTSSSDGRETCTERIGTPSSANSRGTNASPDATEKATAPSDTPASSPNRSRIAAIAASSSVVSMRTRSSPLPAVSAPGVSGATIVPWSMIAILSQNSASSM